MKHEPDPRRVRGVIRRFPHARLLVIGDLMLDHFIWGRVDRISPEAPVPVVRVTHETVHLGGAANVVHNIRALGGHTTACGIVGADGDGRRIRDELRAIGASTAGVIVARGSVTTSKTRIVAHNQQVVRFDREHTQHDAAAAARLAAFVRRNAGRFDAVIVSDYGKGVVTPGLLALWQTGRAPRLIVDPKKPNFAHYRGVTLATPNQQEAAEAAGLDIRDDATLGAAGARLLERWGAGAVLITRGAQGMSLFTADGGARHFPTVARQVFDVTGAGDTVVATCALALASGAHLDEAAWLANHAAGVVIGKLGTATLSAAELRASLADMP